MFIQGATIIVLCACTMLALSSALPQHHQWHWSHPTHRGDSEATAQQWPLNKPGPPGATLFDAQIQETGPGEQSCRTAIGRLTTANGKTIQRSYHLCRQENPQVSLELEDEVVCFYTTAPCCLVPGLPQSVEEISVGSESVKVTYYSAGKKSDLCYRTDKRVTSCLPEANCVPACTGPDPVCFNNTLTESEVSCASGTCQCKENFDPPDCCNCVREYIEINGVCKKACPQFCKIRDRVEGCRECRRGYGPLPTCCNCTEFFYETADETCEEPCLKNIVKCEGGVCTCKADFGGPDCCQCRKNAILSTCDDDGCDECKPGFATPDCCKCDANFYKASDGTCKSPCLKNIVKCEDGVCTCKADYGGRDCCQCRKNAILSTCDDDGCDECKPGFATPDCCKCDANFYKASDGTCKSPCLKNIVKCEDGVCTCKVDYGGRDCCQCRKNAILSTCDDDDCDECKPGFATPDCCKCDTNFYKASDGTCKSPCLKNIVKCEGGVCTCKADYGGRDCCQCRKNAILSTCDDDDCDECKPGFATPDCCKCDANFYKASDGTCKSPCLKNIVKCEGGVCTCKADYGGRDCCQCRKNAILSTCDDDDCDECKPGFATPNCCKCDTNFYKASDGTCKSPCLNNIVKCEDGVCTCKPEFGGKDCCRCQNNIDSCTDTGCTCKKGFQGDYCCTPIPPVVCTSVQDIYFVMDVTLSNHVTPFCEEMYAIELISEAVDSQTGLNGTRIGAYIYPLTESTDATGIRYFKIGNENCQETIQDFHTLMRAVSRGENNKIRPYILGSATYPTPALKLLAKDINAEITSKNAPEDRKRVIVTLTDGGNDGDSAALQNAVNSLKTAGTQTTLIAAGIATDTNTDNIDEFEAGVEMLAGGIKANTIISKDSGAKLGRSLVDVMEENGAICKKQADEIRLRLPETSSKNVYCRCNLPRQKCKAICPVNQAKCRAPPADLCSSHTDVNLQSEDEEQLWLEEEILAAVENVLVDEGIIEVDDY